MMQFVGAVLQDPHPQSSSIVIRVYTSTSYVDILFA